MADEASGGSRPNGRFLLRVGRLVGAPLLAGAAAAMLLSASQPAPREAAAVLPPVPANGEMGFVFSVFAPDIYQGKDECPEGYNGTVRENLLEGMPAADRERLSRKENEEELVRLMRASIFGLNRTNICSNPEQFFPRRLLRSVRGDRSFGLNLDGDATGRPAEGCAHENFVGVDGTAGVDNQYYRGLGCMMSVRGAPGVPSEAHTASNNFLATGEWTIVMLVRGIDSLEKDDDVEVVLANTDDRPYLDSKQNFVSGASFTVTSVPKWRNVLKARIDRGVLTTEASDVLLTQRFGLGGERGKQLDYDLRRARIRVQIKPDGSIDGVLGAYQFPRKILQIPMLGGAGTANVGLDCATQIYTMEQLADGVKDPATGKCTAISTAMHVTAVPAFVNDRPRPGGNGTALR